MLKNDFSTIILAGGKGQRMGGQDKGLALYQGQPLIDRSLVLASQCSSAVVVSANRNIAQYQSRTKVVIKDTQPHYGGPLFGIQACASSVLTDYTLIMACDLPRLTADLIQNLQAVLINHKLEFDAVVYRQGGFLQCGLFVIKTPLLASIDAELVQGQRSVKKWLEAFPLFILETHDAFPFTNFNDPSAFTNDPLSRET